MTARCPNCGREGNYFSGLAGMRVKCVSCPTWVQLPAAGGDEPPVERSPVPPAVPTVPRPPSGEKKVTPRLPRSPYDWSWLTPTWIKWATLAVFVIGVSGLAARLVAGSDFWIGVSIFGAMLVILAVVLFLASLLKRDVPHSFESRVLLVFLIAMCLWWGVGYYFAERTVYVDNLTDQDLTVTVDGNIWDVFPPGVKSDRRMSVGKHLIVVTGSDHQQVDEVSVSLARNGVYILNVGRAQVYHRGSVTYSPSFNEGKAHTAFSETNDAWISAKVDYLFEEPPPYAPVKRRTPNFETVSRTFLHRGRVLGKEDLGKPLKVR